VKIRQRSSEVDKPIINGSHLSFYSSQIKNLEEIAQREGKTRTQVIKEAAKKILNRRTFERNMFNCKIPLGKDTKKVYPCLSKSDWDKLNRISKKTNRFRT